MQTNIALAHETARAERTFLVRNTGNSVGGGRVMIPLLKLALLLGALVVVHAAGELLGRVSK